MDIALHLGVHCTDDGRLARALIRNRARLEAAGTAVPAPRTYRQMLPKLVRSLRGAPAAGEVQDMVRESILGDAEARRVILSHENLACYPAQSVGADGLYPQLHLRMAGLANVFPSDLCTFYLALRNPATLVPEVLSRANVTDYDALMGDTDPLDLRWRPVLLRLLEAAPDAGLVLWCNEDTPLLWPDILRRVAGDGGSEPLEGEEDMLVQLMPDAALARFREFMTSRDGPLRPDQRQRVTAAFLRKFARPEDMEVSVDLPGWSQMLVGEMTEAYDADVAEIAALPGVVFMLP